MLTPWLGEAIPEVQGIPAYARRLSQLSIEVLTHLPMLASGAVAVGSGSDGRDAARRERSRFPFMSATINGRSGEGMGGHDVRASARAGSFWAFELSPRPAPVLISDADISPHLSPVAAPTRVRPRPAKISNHRCVPCVLLLNASMMHACGIGVSTEEAWILEVSDEGKSCEN